MPFLPYKKKIIPQAYPTTGHNQKHKTFAICMNVLKIIDSCEQKRMNAPLFSQEIFLNLRSINLCIFISPTLIKIK